MGELFHELNRRNVRPLTMTLDTTGIVNAPADLFRAVDAFEEAVQPAYGLLLHRASRSAPDQVGPVSPARGETLPAAEIQRRSDEVRQKIEAALPRQAVAKPKKPRTLLVIESLHGMSHDTIPHINVMLERSAGSPARGRPSSTTI